MVISETQVRVRYAETDQMGFAYYGNYATYYEVARVETLRSLEWPYLRIEENGIMLPVLEFRIKYYKPARYDDVINIKCVIPELPGARIRFTYQSFIGDDLINEGETTLVFVDMKTGKPCRPPETFIKMLSAFFPGKP